MHKWFAFDRLRSFVTVAEAGGFSRAAGPASGTQPTLSRQVKDLEAALGRPLLTRFRRQVALTPFGREFLCRARALLAQAEALEASGQAPEGKISGHLHLGAADSVVLGRLPKLLQGFLRRHPRVQVHVHTGSSPDILRWVREGRYDAGLCMLPEFYAGLRFQSLWEDRFVAIAPPRHSLGGRAVPLRVFARERQLGINPGTLSRQVIAAGFHRGGTPWAVDMSFDTFSLVVALVAAGLGVGVASEIVARPAIRRGQVARVRVREIDALRRRLGAALHAGREPDGPLRAFLDEIRRFRTFPEKPKEGSPP